MTKKLIVICQEFSTFYRFKPLKPPPALLDEAPSPMIFCFALLPRVDDDLSVLADFFAGDLSASTFVAFGLKSY
jgi:hypothetical protein